MVRKSWAPALIRRFISITSEGARNLPNTTLITELLEIAHMIFRSSKGVCGGNDFNPGREKKQSILGLGNGFFKPKSEGMIQICRIFRDLISCEL